jgi:hypothetical protein
MPFLDYNIFCLLHWKFYNKDFSFRETLLALHLNTSKVPFARAIFYCDFLLLIDVNEWINNGCAERVPPHLNIRDCSTRSHPSKGEKNRSCEQALKFDFSVRIPEFHSVVFQRNNCESICNACKNSLLQKLHG